MFNFRPESSPSVHMENGTSRLRNSRSYVDRTARTSRYHASKPSVSSFSLRRNSCLIVLFLIICTTACFASAAYLLSFRWESRPSLILDPGPHSNPTVNLEDMHAEAQSMTWHDIPPLSPTPSPHVIQEEKFLSYLPHSGFHNQRIALENALVLARILNRTLLMPPVRLGDKPIGYIEFEKLERVVFSSFKEGRWHCALVPEHVPLPSECLDYFQHTHVSWGWLLNLDGVRSQQRLIDRWDLSDTWLEHALGIRSGSNGSESRDVKSLKDRHRYQYQFFDSQHDESPLNSRFSEKVVIPELARSRRRLIQLGTMFGTGRLRLVIPAHRRARKEIREAMTFSNPVLVRVADAIRDQLGGRWGYWGVHLRLGDEQFELKAEQNARQIWWKLVTEVIGLDVTDAETLEHDVWRAIGTGRGPSLRPPTITKDLTAMRVLHPPPPPLSDISKTLPKLSCHTEVQAVGTVPVEFKQRFNLPLFISTDEPSPRTHPVILPFMHAFPCVFFLSDFASHLDTVHSLRNPHDGVLLGRFLIPVVDAMVASKGRGVVGTSGSTFSRFVEDVLWRRYHDWEIVQRGD